MGGGGSAASAPLDTAALDRGWFTPREKLIRVAWNIVQATLFRASPRRADAWRSMLLRLFGARVGRGCLIRSTIKVEVPWNLSIGTGAQIGEQAIIYNLGPIWIGDHAVISQFTHLCAGTHDFARSDFPLLKARIAIGAYAWVAADCYVGPSISIGEGCVVGARSNVFNDLPAWKICVGSPAKPVKDRPFRRVDDSGRTIAVRTPAGWRDPLPDETFEGAA